MVMTTDDLFNSYVKESAKVLAQECPRYIYDAYFYVKVELDSLDVMHVTRLKKRICRFLELCPIVDFENIDDGHRCSILDATQLKNQRILLHYINRLSIIIASVLDAGAFLFIRLYEENLSDEMDNNGLTLKFANIATKDVKIDTKQLMTVLNDIFNHQCVGFCIMCE